MAQVVIRFYGFFFFFSWLGMEFSNIDPKKRLAQREKTKTRKMRKKKKRSLLHKVGAKGMIRIPSGSQKWRGTVIADNVQYRRQ